VVFRQKFFGVSSASSFFCGNILKHEARYLGKMVKHSKKGSTQDVLKISSMQLIVPFISRKEDQDDLNGVLLNLNILGYPQLLLNWDSE
jgi:hypothetical protein